jgi:hypothetical protein
MPPVGIVTSYVLLAICPSTLKPLVLEGEFHRAPIIGKVFIKPCLFTSQAQEEMYFKALILATSIQTTMDKYSMQRREREVNSYPESARRTLNAMTRAQSLLETSITSLVARLKWIWCLLTRKTVLLEAPASFKLKIKTTILELKAPNSLEIQEVEIEDYVVNKKASTLALTTTSLQSRETKLTTSLSPGLTDGKGVAISLKSLGVEALTSEITANLRMPEEEDSEVWITEKEFKNPRQQEELK